MEALNNDAIAPFKSCLSYDTEILTMRRGAIPIGKIVEHQMYTALNNAIEASIQLYKFLQDSAQFDEKQLWSFSIYLESRSFLNPYRDIYGRKNEHIAAQKEIFDYIIANLNNTNNIVTNEMIEEFQQRYKEYREDAEKYGHETIEQRRDKPTA